MMVMAHCNDKIQPEVQVAKRKNSKQWLKERLNDPYIRKLQHSHYRSRACFKLLELQAKDHFIKPGITIVDLGSAPGGEVAYEIEAVEYC